MTPLFSSARRRLLTTLGSIAVATIGLTGCSSEPEWHPVTTEESQVLGITRFNNFDMGTRPFNTQLTVEGAELTLQGWIGFEHHVGYANVTGQNFEPQNLLWWEDVVALTPGTPDTDGNPKFPMNNDPDQWNIRQYSPNISQLDAAIALISALGVDRPENPLLLQQAGALWLGNEVVTTPDGDVTVDVFSTPPSEQALGPDDPQPTPEDAVVKLWVDEHGVLHRTEALLGDDWVTIDFGTATSPELSPTQLPDIEG